MPFPNSLRRQTPLCQSCTCLRTIHWVQLKLELNLPDVESFRHVQKPLTTNIRPAQNSHLAECQFLLYIIQFWFLFASTRRATEGFVERHRKKDSDHPCSSIVLCCQLRFHIRDFLCIKIISGLHPTIHRLDETKMSNFIDDQWCHGSWSVSLIVTHVMNFRARRGIQLPSVVGMKLPIFGACIVSNPNKILLATLNWNSSTWNLAIWRSSPY